MEPQEDYAVSEFERLTQYPDGSNLIYFP
nr:bacteriocin immunity protein [Xenorhabdus mauleonii]